MATIANSILILTALEQEKQALIEKLTSHAGHGAISKQSLSTRLGLEMSRAQLANRSIAVVKTGIGTVNAALALTLAVERSPVDSVILLGVGGALQPGLDVGDLVISTRVYQHDYFYSFDRDTGPGDTRIRPGALILSSQEAQGHVAEMDADPALIQWMKRAERHTCRKVLQGTVVSGSEFVGRPERKRALAALLPDALLVDMEAAGVAQVAGQLGIPFVVAKTVADRLSPEGSIESDFRECLDAACEHAAAALHSLL